MHTRNLCDAISLLRLLSHSRIDSVYIMKYRLYNNNNLFSTCRRS